VTGNTNANGHQVLSRVNSTQFDLLGTTGNGAYVSGGVVQPSVNSQGVPRDLGMASAEHDALTINEGVVPDTGGGEDTFTISVY
jgi:hypothetical protein